MGVRETTGRGAAATGNAGAVSIGGATRVDDGLGWVGLGGASLGLGPVGLGGGFFLSSFTVACAEEEEDGEEIKGGE